MMPSANLAERRIGVAFLLANVGGDARSKRSAEQRIQYVEHDVIGTCRPRNGEAQVERGLRGAGAIDQMERTGLHGIGRKVRGLGPSGPIAEGILNGVAETGIEFARNVE